MDARDMNSTVQMLTFSFHAKVKVISMIIIWLYDGGKQKLLWFVGLGLFTYWEFFQFDKWAWENV